MLQGSAQPHHIFDEFPVAKYALGMQVLEKFAIGENVRLLCENLSMGILRLYNYHQQALVMVAF